MFRDQLTALATSLLLAGVAAAQAGDIAVQPAMGDPLPDLTPAQLDLFQKGFLEFEHLLEDVEGLGPTFNDTGCAQCHSQPRAGGSSDVSVTRFGKAGPPFDPLASLGGSLLQKEAIDPACFEFIPIEADVTTPRTTPTVFGAGLVESIPDQALKDIAANPPGGGVSGIPHMVELLEDVGGPLHVGRFGWKAQVATMMTFSGDASLNEMGLTNALVGTENAPNGNQALLAQFDLVADPEDHPDAEGVFRIERFTDFQRFLAPPPQTPKSGMSGEPLFTQIGCTNCHVANHTTGTVAEAALSNKVIRPYSDFLLHDMGDLGDGIVQGMGTEQEMRTSSLWGLSARAEIGLLHNAAAIGGTADENIRKAIELHDGEGAGSRDAFAQLATEQQDQVVDFLLSLGQLEFDSDKDDDVDDLDWFFIEFNGWFLGPGADNVSPDDEAALADIDQDGDVDLVDFGLLQRAMTAPENL